VRGARAGHIARAADPRLIAQHFVGQPIGADFGKLDGEAHIVQLAQRLPVLRREIGVADGVAALRRPSASPAIMP
jgi:hypothetical protein